MLLFDSVLNKWTDLVRKLQLIRQSSFFWIPKNEGFENTILQLLQKMLCSKTTKPKKIVKGAICKNCQINTPHSKPMGSISPESWDATLALNQ